MTKFKLVNFIDMATEDVNLVLYWRNHPLIREWMITRHEISREEHLSFIDKLKLRDESRYFLVKERLEPIGVISFCKITVESTEMGIYSGPNVKGKGKDLLKIIQEYAFNELKVNTIISQVMSQNKKAIRLYEMFKFKTMFSNDPEMIAMRLELEDWQL